MKYLLTIFLVFNSVTVSANSLPEGWFLTTADQYLEEDIKWFKGVPPNKVSADFNGDKIADTAWILTDKAKSKWGLFVSLSQDENKYQIIKLDENEIKSHIFVGISPLEPGKHKTACGKGYWDCDKDELPIIETTNTGINYYVFESANSVFLWDKTNAEFKRIWLSD